MDWKLCFGVAIAAGLVVVLFSVLNLISTEKTNQTLRSLNSSLLSKASGSDFNNLILALKVQNGAGLQCLQKYAYCQQVAYNANADLNGTPVIAFTETCVLLKGSD